MIVSGIMLNIVKLLSFQVITCSDLYCLIWSQFNFLCLLNSIYINVTGECWSGKGVQKTYDKENTSPFCITKEFAECNAEDEHVCSGNKTTAFIYSVKENHNPKKGIHGNIHEIE